MSELTEQIKNGTSELSEEAQKALLEAKEHAAEALGNAKDSLDAVVDIDSLLESLNGFPPAERLGTIDELLRQSHSEQESLSDAIGDTQDRLAAVRGELGSSEEGGAPSLEQMGVNADELEERLEELQNLRETTLTELKGEIRSEVTEELLEEKTKVILEFISTLQKSDLENVLAFGTLASGEKMNVGGIGQIDPEGAKLCAKEGLHVLAKPTPEVISKLTTMLMQEAPKFIEAFEKAIEKEIDTRTEAKLKEKYEEMGIEPETKNEEESDEDGSPENNTESGESTDADLPPPPPPPAPTN